MDGGAGGGQKAAGETDAGPASVNTVESTKGKNPHSTRTRDNWNFKEIFLKNW